MDYINIDFTYPLKFVWRVWQCMRLRKRGIRISPLARWNGQTTFGGHNTISSGVTVGCSAIGRYTFICKDSDLAFCEIGSFCSIASGVKVVRFRHPTDKFVSTSPVFYSTKKQCGKSFVSQNGFEEQKLVEGRSAIIGNDVWIGEDVKIMEGIRINTGAIVAAGAVVTKDIPPYAIAGGVPAKIIRHRFSDNQIESLLKTEWWKKDDEWLEKHVLQFSDIDDFINELL